MTVEFLRTPFLRTRVHRANDSNVFRSMIRDGSRGRWLFSWAAVADVLALRERLERFFHAHQHRRLDRGYGAARVDGKHHACHRDVVRRLVDRVAVVLAEAVPKAVQGATHLFDVGARCIAAIFRVLDQLRPRLRRVAKAHEIESHREPPWLVISNKGIILLTEAWRIPE